MHTYRKGSRVERELIRYFHSHGFFVVRAAGSGVSSLSPDVLVFKGGKQFAFEIKAHETGTLTIYNDQYTLLKEWEEKTGITPYVVWKKSSLPFLFVPLSFLKKAKKNWNVSFEDALNGYKKEDLVFS